MAELLVRQVFPNVGQGGNAMRHLSLTLFAAILASCAIQPVEQPKNREELKAAIAKGTAFMKVQTYVANRRFEDAARLLKTKTEECLNYRLTEGTRNVATGLPTGTTSHDYRATFRTVNKARAELTMQHNPLGPRIGPKMPDGGFYIMAVDVDRASGNTTNLTFYGPSMGWDQTYAAIKKWSEGEAVGCPRR
jgi:hypothetical protein